MKHPVGDWQYNGQWYVPYIMQPSVSIQAKPFYEKIDINLSIMSTVLDRISVNLLISMFDQSYDFAWKEKILFEYYEQFYFFHFLYIYILFSGL